MKTVLVEELQTLAAVLTLLKKLRPGAFKSSLSKHLARTSKKIQMKAEMNIFLKEIKKANTNLGRGQIEKKSNEERPRKEMRTRVRRYHEYTPLNVSLAELYREVGHVERLPKLKALKIRASMNRSLFYEYHNDFRHRTEDCYDLRDAVEQLIRESRLAKYIASQRSPKKIRASPSRNKERRNLRNQKISKPEKNGEGDKEDEPITRTNNVIIGGFQEEARRSWFAKNISKRSSVYPLKRLRRRRGRRPLPKSSS